MYILLFSDILIIKPSQKNVPPCSNMLLRDSSFLIVRISHSYLFLSVPGHELGHFKIVSDSFLRIKNALKLHNLPMYDHVKHVSDLHFDGKHQVLKKEV